MANYHHYYDCNMADPGCAACRENGVREPVEEETMKTAQMEKGRPLHKPSCDEMHQHAPPKCCSPDCWCHDLAAVDKIVLRCGELMTPPFRLEVGGHPITAGVEAIDVQLRAGQLHKLVVTLNAAEIDIEIKGRLGESK